MQYFSQPKLTVQSRRICKPPDEAIDIFICWIIWLFENKMRTFQDSKKPIVN